MNTISRNPEMEIQKEDLLVELVTLLRLLVLRVRGGVVWHVVNGTLWSVRTRYGAVLLRHKSSIGARLRVWETSGEDEERQTFKCVFSAFEDFNILLQHLPRGALSDGGRLIV